MSDISYLFNSEDARKEYTKILEKFKKEQYDYFRRMKMKNDFFNFCFSFVLKNY